MQLLSQERKKVICLYKIFATLRLRVKNLIFCSGLTKAITTFS